MKIKIEDVKPGELFWVSAGYHAQSHVSDAVIMTVADCETPSYIQRGSVLSREYIPDEVWVNRKEEVVELVLHCCMASSDTLVLDEAPQHRLRIGINAAQNTVVLRAEDESKLRDYLLARSNTVAIDMQELRNLRKELNRAKTEAQNLGEELAEYTDKEEPRNGSSVIDGDNDMRMIIEGDNKSTEMTVSVRTGKYRPGLMFDINGWNCAPIEAEEVQLLALLLRRRGCAAITLEEMEEYSKMKERMDIDIYTLSPEPEKYPYHWYELEFFSTYGKKQLKQFILDQQNQMKLMHDKMALVIAGKNLKLQDMILASKMPEIKEVRKVVPLGSLNAGDQFMFEQAFLTVKSHGANGVCKFATIEGVVGLSAHDRMVVKLSGEVESTKPAAQPHSHHPLVERICNHLEARGHIASFMRAYDAVEKYRVHKGLTTAVERTLDMINVNLKDFDEWFNTEYPMTAAQSPAETEQDKYWRMFKKVLNLLTVPGVSAPTRAKIRDVVSQFWTTHSPGAPRKEFDEMVDLELHWDAFEAWHLRKTLVAKATLKNDR